MCTITQGGFLTTSNRDFDVLIHGYQREATLQAPDLPPRLLKALRTTGVVLAIGAFVAYLDSHENDPPQGGVFERHTVLYNQFNKAPPVGKLLPSSESGFRGYYYIDRKSPKLRETPVLVAGVSYLPPDSPRTPTAIHRRPFVGVVDCMIWVMGMGRKFNELQIVDGQFELARSEFECQQQALLFHVTGENIFTALPRVETIRLWRADYPWEFARWGLID